MTEAQLQKAVIEIAHRFLWLVAHFRTAQQGGRWLTPVQGDGKGFPDLILVRGERVVVAELKQNGRYPSAEQYKWLNALQDAGMETYVWRVKDWEEGVVEERLR